MIRILDCETTGIAKTDQVIQFASISIADNRHSLLKHNVKTPLYEQHQKNSFTPTEAITKLENKFFNPTVPINKHAQDVHGISKLKLIKHPSVTTFKVPKIKILIAHNAHFDFRMLKQTDSNWDFSDTKVICTCSLAKQIEKISKIKFGFENYQLKSIFKFFYPELLPKYETKLHDALGDCEMTLLIMIKLWEKFPFITKVEELQEYFFQPDGKIKKL